MFDPENLKKIANIKRPLAKHKNRTLIELTETYLVWLVGQGFPQGQIGELLQLTYEFKVNALEKLIYPLQGE